MKFLSLGAVGTIRVLNGKDFWSHGGAWMGPAVGETVASASCSLKPSHSCPFFFSTPMYPLWGHTSSKRLHPTLSRLRTACLLWTLWRVEGCSKKETGGGALITVCQALLPGLSQGCFCLILVQHSGTSFLHMTTWHILAIKAMWYRRRNSGPRARNSTPLSSHATGATSLTSVSSSAK